MAEIVRRHALPFGLKKHENVTDIHLFCRSERDCVFREDSPDRQIQVFALRGGMCRDFPSLNGTCRFHPPPRHLCTKKDLVLAQRSLRKKIA